MLSFGDFSIWTNVGLLAVAAVIICVVGWQLAEVADKLADRTGMGEAIAGAVLLGAATSLPGIVTSVSTAYTGYADLAVSNAVGGIAVQTVFLVVADLCYPRANLEHAAASVQNLLQGTLLLMLLAVPLLAITTPEVSLWGIHPATPIMLVGYLYGLRIVMRARNAPMWQPEQTSETQEDVPEEDALNESLSGLWLRFVGFAAIVGVAGWVVGQTGAALSEQSGLSQAAVGVLLTSVVTSLPELVTSISAVRRGAQTMAVGGIIGGNAFDTLFVAVSDIAYRDGSIYHAVGQQQIFLIGLTMLLTSTLLLGLVQRERRGIGNIGLEGWIMLLVYVGAVILTIFTG